MDIQRFERLSRFFASRRLSRRDAGTGAGLPAPRVAAATAQEATPESSGSVLKPGMMFVQSFQSGTISPVPGVAGRYAATFDHGLGQTIYFSDRPERTVGAVPTPTFLATLGFTPDNPPNAAILTDDGAGETTLAVVELFNPVYDAAGPTVTYELAVLANWQDSLDLGFSEAPTDLAAMAPSFGSAHLFIDGPDSCPGPGPDYSITCTPASEDGEGGHVGTIPSSDFGGYCLSGIRNIDDDIPYWCLPCSSGLEDRDAAIAHWSGVCNQRFSDCEGDCFADGVYERPD